MDANATIHDRISAYYNELSSQLRTAADYVADNPLEVATRSLRSVAAACNVSPPTFSRLARALEFESYEEMRELCRQQLGRRAISFSDRAAQLQSTVSTSEQKADFLHRQAHAATANIAAMVDNIDMARLEAAVDRLGESGRVILVGTLGSSGIIEYFSYLARWFTGNWVVAGRNGLSLGPVLADVNENDVVVIVTYSPFARRSIAAAEIAASNNAFVLVVTDIVSCPALKYADLSFTVPTDSPQFFSSYVSVILLFETIAGMLVARMGEQAQQRIEEVEKNNHQLGEYWAV